MIPEAAVLVGEPSAEVREEGATRMVPSVEADAAPPSEPVVAAAPHALPIEPPLAAAVSAEAPVDTPPVRADAAPVLPALAAAAPPAEMPHGNTSEGLAEAPPVKADATPVLAEPVAAAPVDTPFETPRSEVGAPSLAAVANDLVPAGNPPAVMAATTAPVQVEALPEAPVQPAAPVMDGSTPLQNGDAPVAEAPPFDHTPPAETLQAPESAPATPVKSRAPRTRSTTRKSATAGKTTVVDTAAQPDAAVTAPLADVAAPTPVTQEAQPAAETLHLPGAADAPTGGELVSGPSPVPGPAGETAGDQVAAALPVQSDRPVDAGTGNGMAPAQPLDARVEASQIMLAGQQPAATAPAAEIEAPSEPVRPRPARRTTKRTASKAAPPREAAPEATDTAATSLEAATPAPQIAAGIPISVEQTPGPIDTPAGPEVPGPLSTPAAAETPSDGTSVAAASQVPAPGTDGGVEQTSLPLVAQADMPAAGEARPRIGQRPSFQNQQGRPAPTPRVAQPFNQRPVPPTPLPPQNDFNGQSDAQRGRRRRRRRGRGGLGNPPAPGMVANGQTTAPSQAPLPIQPPPVYEERVAPQPDFATQRLPVFEAEGMLDFLPNGEAFLREEDLRERSTDFLIGVRDIRRFDLRNGDSVRIEARQGRGRGPVTVERVISINDIPFERMRTRKRFEDLTPIYPDRMIKLETGQLPLTTRILDLFAPVGFGQRALIVSPPKAGKTTMLKNIGTGVLANYPNASLIVCLVGERPEEVTDLRMSLPRAIMFASSFDEDVERHGHLAEMALERARRLAEQGKDVVVLLDSITRLARAYNLGGGGGGRTLSGGMDATALTTARRIFGAARAIEQGGSLTIIATCLIDTGSRLDDVVYEEFKGTGNMELHLDRALAERRIFPAIDISRSGTRKEELLLDPQTLQFVVALRRRLAGSQAVQATERLIESLGKTPSNKVFFDLLSRAQ
jgi:transcription termination factor Rho